ncbi:MAG TPA: hypothetical protein PLA16_10600 [Chitinophagales bacterium]|nr:hypothetical protein [Chitinophagales bacterium]
MKISISIFLIITMSFSFAQGNEVKLKSKKHELNIALHYAQHKFGDHPLPQIRIFSPDKAELLDSVDVGKKVGHGVGLRVQYNYFVKEKIYLATSLNLFFYSPGVVKYDWTKNSKTFPYEIFHPILSFSDYEGQVSYSANQCYVDFGVGFVPISKGKFNWRIGLGFGLGYHYYTDPITQWRYDYVYVPEFNETYLNFQGFIPYALYSFLWGGYVETSFNYDIVPNKFSLGLDYKFMMAKKYRHDGVYPQSVGLLFNIKL